MSPMPSDQCLLKSSLTPVPRDTGIPYIVLVLVCSTVVFLYAFSITGLLNGLSEPLDCGLFVPAKSFASGLYSRVFTHFTRREDSAMNSGRLDEELGRMNQIVENLGEHSMVLLNESFATTTEKEGSVIAYDIIKALTEAGVKILTVTHLLSFAQRMYDEERYGSGVEFFSAERLENGKRTF